MGVIGVELASALFAGIITTAIVMKRNEYKAWETAVQTIKDEITPERKHAMGAFQHYMDFKLLDEDKEWFDKHELITPSRQGKHMLTDKGLFVLRKLGYNVF